MSTSIAELVLDAPRDRETLWRAAFPRARDLIAGDEYLAGDDESVYQRWLKEVIVPALQAASEEIKASLRYCLEPRAKAEIAALAAGINFLGGFLPHYPGGLAPAVAALIVLVAHDLHDRELI
jgi:hypothetical protein